jgi:hypothetical protein
MSEINTAYLLAYALSVLGALVTLNNSQPPIKMVLLAVVWPYPAARWLLTGK